MKVLLCINHRKVKEVIHSAVLLILTSKPKRTHILSVKILKIILFQVFKYRAMDLNPLKEDFASDP